MAQINGFEIWDDDFDREHFTPEEIAESNLGVGIVKNYAQISLQPW